MSRSMCILDGYTSMVIPFIILYRYPYLFGDSGFVIISWQHRLVDTEPFLIAWMGTCGVGWCFLKMALKLRSRRHYLPGLPQVNQVKG